ncbi:MAG: hypothetical protein MN733_35265 [Nitrososphaera sp.]|nr:hypothetical protein [Nitrososphaera sp.]
MPELVNDLDEIIQNLREYQKVVRLNLSIKATPSKVSDWFYFPSVNMAGPSRFIGYKDMSALRYDIEELWGGQTQDHLTKPGWFRQMEPGEPLYEEARKAVERLVRLYNPWSLPRSGAKYFVLTEENNQNAQIRLNRQKYGASYGEGITHKRLKEWCCANPDALSVHAPVITYCDNYPFPSGDRPDILFECSGTNRVVVEIETNSPLPGFYQVIKYKALAAVDLEQDIGSSNIRGILVAWEFPTQVKELADKYGVELFTKKL